MVLNKRSIEGSTRLSDDVSLKNRHVHKYGDGASELSENNKKYYIDDSQLEQESRTTNSKINSTKQQQKPKSKNNSNTISGTEFKNNRKYVIGVAIFFSLYYCAMMYYRYQHRGLVGFADTFWLCNFTLVFGILAIIFNKPYMMGMAVSCTAVVHFLWTIDAISGLTTGVFPIGNAEYLVWPDITWGEIFTTTHHVWFVPLAISTLHRNGGYPKRSWLGCIVLLGPVVYASSLFPKTITLQDGSEFYLNINLVHEWWSDVRGWPFSLIPHEPYLHYLIFFLSFCIVLFVVTHNVLKAISHFIIDKN